MFYVQILDDQWIFFSLTVINVMCRRCLFASCYAIIHMYETSFLSLSHNSMSCSKVYLVKRELAPVLRSSARAAFWAYICSTQMQCKVKLDLNVLLRYS